MFDEFVSELCKENIESKVFGHLKTSLINPEDFSRQSTHYVSKSLNDVLVNCLSSIGGVRILSNEMWNLHSTSIYSLSKRSIGIENQRVIEEIPRFLRKPRKLIRLKQITDMDKIRKQLCESNPEMDMFLFRKNYLVYRACVGICEMKPRYEPETKKYFIFDVAVIHGKSLD